MVILGNFYREGRPGFPIDNRIAAKYYRMAALKKNPEAQFTLAEMYKQGAGVPQDNIQAYVFYSLAYNGGFMPAYAAREQLRQMMPSADFNHAEKMVAALSQTNP